MPTFCPSCGKSVQGNEKFCIGCGAELPQTQNQPQQTAAYTENYQAAAPAQNFCVNCGNPFDAEWKFCHWCGTAAVKQNINTFSQASAAASPLVLTAVLLWAEAVNSAQTAALPQAPAAAPAKLPGSIRRQGLPTAAPRIFREGISSLPISSKPASNSSPSLRSKPITRSNLRISNREPISSNPRTSSLHISRGNMPRDSMPRGSMLNTRSRIIRRGQRKSRVSLSRTFCLSAYALQ